VLLFSSAKKIKMPGTLVKMDDIRSWMKEIVPIEEYPDGMRFNVADGSVLYLYPIIPTGNMGVYGNEFMLANLKPFRDVEKVVSNRDCILTMTWPPGATAAKLVISDEEVKGEGDPNAETVYVRKDEYLEDKQIRIPMGKSRRKFINMFAEYEVAGERISSHGIALEVFSASCKKVRYDVTVGSVGTILDFVTDYGVPSLPPMVAVRATEGIPLKKTDGEIVWRSEGVTLHAGKATEEVHSKGFSDPARVRLFFENDADYNLYRFIHPLYGRHS